MKVSKWIKWQRLLKSGLAWGSVILLAVFTWRGLKQIAALEAMRPMWLVGLFSIHVLLALALERALHPSVLTVKWRYRLSFLVSAGLAPAYWAAIWIGGAPGVQLSAGFYRLMGVSLGVAWAGALVGALIATSAYEGLWENNSPPPEYVQEEVHRLHVGVIGAPDRGPFSKRLFDYLQAALGLVLSAPVWMLCALVLWFEDPGPVLFVKNSVGKGGVNFHQFKFRTMVRGAEEGTGPVMAEEQDERVLSFGRFLRKTALDELPQLLNILRGEMSLVGPRPQRTVLVKDYLAAMPEYAERHRVLPGLAGLAQVAGDYYLTPRQKLRFDRLYIRYSSLGFDLKLLALAFLITFWFRWQPGWDGRLPRRLLH